MYSSHLERRIRTYLIKGLADLHWTSYPLTLGTDDALLSINSYSGYNIPILVIFLGDPMDFTMTKEHPSLSKQENSEQLSMHPITRMSMERLQINSN